MLQIQRAIVGGEQVELQRLLDEEAGERDWGWRGIEGKTALELAAVTGQSEMVKMLIGAGAHTNELSASGKVCHNGSTLMEMSLTPQVTVHCTLPPFGVSWTV